MEPGHEMRKGAGQDEGMSDISCDFCFQRHRMPVPNPEIVLPYENDLKFCHKLVHDLLPFLRGVGSETPGDRPAVGCLEGSFSDESDARRQGTLLWAIACHLNQLRTSNSDKLEPALRVVADASRDGWPPRTQLPMG